MPLDEFPEDAFLMVAQEHWEDKIEADIPYTPSPQYSGVGGVWRPLNEGTFAHQISMGRSNVDSAAEEGSLPTSLFPIENYDLIYNRWEDDIIYDDTVLKVPQPSVAQIDPNDPNFIIGIPVEPPPTSLGEKDGRKVCESWYCIPKQYYVSVLVGVQETGTARWWAWQGV